MGLSELPNPSAYLKTPSLDQVTAFRDRVTGYIRQEQKRTAKILLPIVIAAACYFASSPTVAEAQGPGGFMPPPNWRPPPPGWMIPPPGGSGEFYPQHPTAQVYRYGFNDRGVCYPCNVPTEISSYQNIPEQNDARRRNYLQGWETSGDYYTGDLTTHSQDLIKNGQNGGYQPIGGYGPNHRGQIIYRNVNPYILPNQSGYGGH